jgi:hypothetical protein
MDCEETRDVLWPEQRLQRVCIAEALTPSSFKTEGCVDLPLESFNLIGYSNENAFFRSLLKSF